MKLFLRLLLMPAAMVAALFGSAGRWDLPLFWAYVAVFPLFALVSVRVVDPALLRERLRPAAGGKDRHLRWIAMSLILVHWILAGLDTGRFHWSDSLPTAVSVVALAGVAASLGFTVWAMAVNPFFSPVVRIQSERGHRLISHGPYRFVRHPGYVAALFSCVFGGLALGSLWAMVPLAAIIILVLRRTALEDRFLQAELEGYAEYSGKVRYRLLPGVW